MSLRPKRIYDPPSPEDGYRVLVDRLWPRGVTKDRAALDRWMKEVAPSDRLRKWFGHLPEHWEEFVARYREELIGNPAVEELLRWDRGEEHPDVTLLYAARDRERNTAEALLRILRKR